MDDAQLIGSPRELSTLTFVQFADDTPAGSINAAAIVTYAGRELPLIGPHCRRVAAAGRGVDRPAPEPDVRGSPPLAGAAALKSGISPGLIALTPKAHSVKLCCFGGNDS